MHPKVDGELDLEELLGTELASELDSFGIQNQKFVGDKTIDMKLNWKFANDTFGETYHFGKLHNSTLGSSTTATTFTLKSSAAITAS